MPPRSGVKQFDCIKAVKALGEAHRLRIVRMRLGGEYGVNDIAETLGIRPYNLSRRLRVRREAGLVECEKEGRLRLQILAPAFKRPLSAGNMMVDLGCCPFEFRNLPK